MRTKDPNQQEMDSRKELLERELERVTEILKKDYAPEKLILFGSLASGEVGEWSDLDLVIIKETDKRFLERIEEVLKLLRPRIALDVLVYTPEEIKEMVEEKNYFISEEVLGKGEIIYDKGK